VVGHPVSVACLRVLSGHPYGEVEMAERPLSFEVSQSLLNESTALVTVAGEIDFETAPRFDKALSDVVDDKRTHGIVVDLSGVSFLDSSALNALIRCFERQKLRMEGLCLVAQDSRVTTLLEVARLDRILRVVPDREQALHYVTSPADAVPD
jgi:anti-sigma B factor antagonist